MLGLNKFLESETRQATRSDLYRIYRVIYKNIKVDFKETKNSKMWPFY